MILNIILLIIGFIILIKCADIFVDGASEIATHFHLSKLLIGLTIVAFGTSAPEFAVSCKSIISGSGDIVLGNVIGSNILNILLILGASALFHSLNVKNNTVKKELPITILITTLLVVLLADNFFDKNAENIFTRGDGIAVLLFFAIFIYYLISQMRHKVDNEEEREKEEKPKHKLPISIVLTILGIAGIIIGSNLVVDSSAFIARAMGVSEKMIALTIVALGTSLPELVTSITATRKGVYDIAIGNVVGSNIFNVGIVLGIPVALFGGITNYSINAVDLIVMLLATILLFIFALTKRKVTMREGIIFLIIFVIYYSYVIYMH